MMMMIRGWEMQWTSPTLGAYDANISLVYAQDRPCVMKTRIVREVAMLNNVTANGGSRVKLENILIVQSVNCCANGQLEHQWWKVRNHKRSTARGGNTWVQAALLGKAGQ
jgi:hypothetical protein